MIADAIRVLLDRVRPVMSYTRDHGGIVLVHDNGQRIHEIRQPSRVRRHTFHDLEDFAAFLKREFPDDDLGRNMLDVLFDATCNRVVADFSADEPDDQSDIVKCDLKEHPRLKWWTSQLGRSLTQQAFYKLVATACDADFDNATDNPADGTMRAALAGNIQVLQVRRDASFEGQLDHRGFYRLKSAVEGADIVSARIPAEIGITVPWYQGLDEFTYRLELLVDVEIPEKGAPTFVLSCPALPLVQAAAVEDAVGKLRTLLGEDFLVCRGAHEMKSVELL